MTRLERAKIIGIDCRLNATRLWIKSRIGSVFNRLDPVTPSLLKQALALESSARPAPAQVVEALLAAEKKARQTSVNLPFDQLLGTWQLSFITGTQKAQRRSGIVLGAGRYLPRWIKVSLTYSQSDSELHQGAVENVVEWAGAKLIVQGPAQLRGPKNILAFDFTRICLQLWGLPIYRGYIRGGRQREDLFNTLPIRDQAFFVYFLVDDTLAAARGRGGGLAIWKRL